MLADVTVLILVLHYQKAHYIITYRNSIKAVSLEALLGSNDILGQVQTVKREIYRRLQFLLPSALVGEAAQMTHGGTHTHIT